MLMFYAWFVLHVVDNVLFWYQALPLAERSLEASGLAASVITAVTGLGSWFLKVYLDSGRAWRGRADDEEDNGDK